jgi:antitoxin PrlF
MNVQRGRLVSGGRLQVPADIRRALGLNDGDAVLMRVVDGALQVRAASDAVRRVQERLKPYRIEGALLSDELIADRRAAAADE